MTAPSEHRRSKATRSGKARPERSAARRNISRCKPEPPVRRIEAIWLEGPVPHGYWDHQRNRRKYLRWLGQQLGFRQPEDWYRISTDHFKQNRGSGVLGSRWNSSAVCAIRECFPERDWKEWLFRHCPQAFWKDPANRRRYMEWLGQQLGIRRLSDWYNVTNKDFQKHKGGAFLLHFDSTISRAVMESFPEYDWKEWLFRKIPKGLWDEKRNRRRYLSWLGAQLGFRKRSDWYSATRDDFHSHHGKNFLMLHDGSPYAALKDCFPRYDWKEWMFARVPLGFWDEPENRKRYMQWLGKRLGFHKPTDWCKIRRHHFIENCGGGLVVRFGSHKELLKEHLPTLDRGGPASQRGPAQRRSGGPRKPTLNGEIELSTS